jgi:hypothetical protein
VAEEILLQIALSGQQEKTTANAKFQTMMVDKEQNVKTKIYSASGDFCRRVSLLFLAEFCRCFDGHGHQHCVWVAGVLELPMAGAQVA